VSEELTRLMDVFELVENELDTDRFIHLGMPIWPIIKWEIYLREYLDGKEQKSKQNWLNRLGSKLMQVAESIIAETSSRQEKKSSNKYASQKCKIYYLTYSTSRVKYKNKYYDKFLIPISELISQLPANELRNFRLEGAEYFTNGIHIQPRLDSPSPINILYLKNHLFAVLRTHFTKERDKIQMDLAPLNQLLSENGLKNINAKSILIKSHLTYLMYQWFYAQLKNIKPDKIVLSNYVGPIGWGLAYAGSKLNIDSYEFQHGVLDLNPAYTFSLKRGSNFIKILPNYIFVWNRDQARVIENWGAGKVKAIVTGNIVNFYSSKSDLEGNLKIEYDNLRERINEYEGVVLFTLQDKIYTFEYILDIIIGLVAAKSMARYFFLIRLHPNMLKERAAYARSFLEYSNTDVNFASELPLSRVFHLTDLHITVSSSVTIECAEVGISTILLSAEYAEYYSSLVRSGAVYVKGSGEQLDRVISERLCAHSIRSNESEIDTLKVIEETLLTGHKS
jgi:hypothetical protein